MAATLEWIKHNPFDFLFTVMVICYAVRYLIEAWKES